MLPSVPPETRQKPMNARIACACISALALSAGMAACSSSSSDGGSTKSGASAATTGSDAGPLMVLSNGCPMNSGYVGDDRCLAPPPADQGFQLHYGPTDYASSAGRAPYELAPNGDQV